MCITVLPRTPIRRLIGAAQHIQRLLDDGTLAAAFTRTEGETLAVAVAGFDALAEAAAALASEQKEVSPFLRYRREILDEGVLGGHLRNLVSALYIGPAEFIDLPRLFRDVDAHHARIAIELLAAYANLGAADPQFRSLAAMLHNATLHGRTWHGQGGAA